MIALSLCLYSSSPWSAGTTDSTGNMASAESSTSSHKPGIILSALNILNDNFFDEVIRHLKHSFITLMFHVDLNWFIRQTFCRI